jgi:hypothetical protein
VAEIQHDSRRIPALSVSRVLVVRPSFIETMPPQYSPYPWG